MRNELKLHRHGLTIPNVRQLGVHVSHPRNAPDKWDVAMLRLPNWYYVVITRSAHHMRAVVLGHYVVPYTRVVDPRPLKVDPFTGTEHPEGIFWDNPNGHGIGSVLRALATLPMYRQAS